MSGEGILFCNLRTFQEFLCDLDSLVSSYESESTLSGQRQILAKIQKGLILTQDIGDDKLVIVQNIADLIENKARLLEHDAKNLDFGKEDEEEDAEAAETVAAPATSGTTERTSSKKHSHGGGGGGGGGGKQTVAASGGKNRASGAGHADRDREDKADSKSSGKKGAKF